MIKYTMDCKPASSGFGYSWSLVLTRGKKEKKYLLGPEKSVCYKLLGMSPSALKHKLSEDFHMPGKLDMKDEGVLKAIVQLVIQGKFPKLDNVDNMIKKIWHYYKEDELCV
jgi:hypothetical protein